MSRVLLFGASGYTGRLVAEALSEHGVAFTAVSRAASRLDGIPAANVLRLDLHDSESLQRLLTPADLVVNCAGPFQLHARPLVAAVASAGARYLDICGEAEFVAWSQQTQDRTARDRGALLVHGCAFESLPAEMLAQLLCEPDRSYEEIASFYVVPPTAASPGTVSTMRLVAQHTNYTFEAGKYVERRPGTISHEVTLPFNGAARAAVFAPYPELRFWPRRYDTRAAGSFLLLREFEAALLQRALPAPPRDSSETRTLHEPRRRVAPDAAKRRAHAFTIGVVAAAADGTRDVAWLTGVDPYGFTAALATWSCQQLLQDARGRGVVGPGDVFESDIFLAAAAQWPFELKLNRARLSPSRE